MWRRYDLRRIKSHWSYTTGELCDTLRISTGTVRAWTRQGLRPIPGTRPYLFAAADIVQFLRRRNRPRQPLKPGEIYSVACRMPVTPAGGIVDVMRRSETSADLIGVCPNSGRRIYRRIRLSELEEKLGSLKVGYQDVSAPIGTNRTTPRSASLEGAVA